MKRFRFRTEALVAISVLLAAMGQIFIKMGLTNGTRLSNTCLRWPVALPFGLVLGLLIYGVGTLLWFAAVSQDKISYLYPLAATNYVLLGLAGHFMLHEAMGLARWLGIAVMAIGIAMLSVNEKGADRHAHA